MKYVLTLIIFFSIISCKSEKKEHEFKHEITNNDIDTLMVYNHILDGLLENHLYNSYLGEKSQVLYIDLINKKIDSTTYLIEKQNLKSNILKNDSLKGTLYINNDYIGLTDKKHPFEGYKKNIKPYSNIERLGFDIDKIIVKIKKGDYLNIDSLESKFVKIESLSNKNLNTSEMFNVGVISFSKIMFNSKKDLGVVYIEFASSGKGSMGALTVIRKINNEWEVKNSYPLWKT